MLQYTAASLALENQSLASPDSVLSLPSSGGKEDHNANAMTAARHAAQILSNVEHIVATELYVAARALDLRLMEGSKLRPGDAVAAALQAIREVVPFQGNDSLWGPELEELKEKALAGQILVD
jgi:histidine ammonia-lyase